MGGGAQPARGCHVSAADVVVVGGGLAGITAALDCASAGAAVTLLEVRPRLGGAAYSFERDGLSIDNGQHVFLRCCEAYRALLGRLGSEHRVHLQRHLEIPVLTPGRRDAVLRRGSLPAPLHLAGALARYDRLTLRERIAAARAAWALGRLPLDGQSSRRTRGGELLDWAPCGKSRPSVGSGGGSAPPDRTLGAWLAEHGQSEAAVAALWDLIALPTLNVPAAEGSLALGAFVLQTGLLSSRDAGDIGFHRRPLSETIGEPALRVLAQAGVDVRLGARVDRVQRERGAMRVLGHNLQVQAQAAVVAVPHARAAALLAPLLGEQGARPGRLGSSPIVNIHVVYDRRVCEWPFAAGVGTPVQYVFDRTEASGLHDGQYLAISLSGARREMSMSIAHLRERYVAALEDLFPAARGARVRRVLVTREHAATFRAAPGSQALRPGPRTSVEGLVLAGAWTDTGWPATLEGAVLSGHAAAREVLG